MLRRPGVPRLVWCTVTGFSGFALLLSALPLWAVRGGADPGLAGAVTAVTLAATVATQFAVPGVVERWGTGPALAAGLLLLGAPAPLYGLGADLGPLLALSAVRGVGFGLLTVVGSLLVALLAPPGAHGRTAGVYGLAIAAPNLLAVPGGVLLAEQVSFPLVMALAAAPVLGVPAALGFGRLGARDGGSRNGGTQDDAGRDGAGRVGAGRPGARRPGVTAPVVATGRARAARASLAPAAVLLAATLVGGAVLTFVPIGLPPGGLLAPSALLAVGLAAALGRWLVGGAADRVGAGSLLPPSVLVTAAGAVAVGAALGPAGDGAARAALLLAGATAAGAGYGAVQNLTLVLAFSRAGPAGSATASAVWNAAFDTGTALGAFAVGALAATGAGLPLAVALTGAVGVAVLPVALALRR